LGHEPSPGTCPLPPPWNSYADIVRLRTCRAELEPGPSPWAIQAIKGLETSPGLRRSLSNCTNPCNPAPLRQRPPRPPWSGVEAITPPPRCDRHYHCAGSARRNHPSVAGNIEWEPIRDLVGHFSANWEGSTPPGVHASARPPTNQAHLTKGSEQTQMPLPIPAFPVWATDYYNYNTARGRSRAVPVAWAPACHGSPREGRPCSTRSAPVIQPDEGRAARLSRTPLISTPGAAEKRLDKCLEELRRLPNGIEDEELEPSRSALKTGSLIISPGSTLVAGMALASAGINLRRGAAVRGVRRPNSNGLNTAPSCTTLAPPSAARLQRLYARAGAPGLRSLEPHRHRDNTEKTKARPLLSYPLFFTSVSRCLCGSVLLERSNAFHMPQTDKG